MAHAAAPEDEEEYKQVMVVRKDLELGCGKLAAQVAHASLGSYEECRRDKPHWVHKWSQTGSRKIVAKVKGEHELFELMYKARSEGIPFYAVRDAGLTQVPPNTLTCVGFGPAPSWAMDKVTGELKLL
ncbi:MAG: peptidyl-tRNA hydrolase Pth2 [Candidatus Marsarchaeota archaeon]|nr:peptidyl-tRNA hydrolase Pth2 [Candidatus Marsarchaeota archaeon]